MLDTCEKKLEEDGIWVDRQDKLPTKETSRTWVGRRAVRYGRGEAETKDGIWVSTGREAGHLQGEVR